MDFEEVSKKAYLNKGPDENWKLPAKYLYLRLNILYNKFKIGEISKDESIIEKKKIEKEFLEHKLEYDRITGVYREYNENRVKGAELLTELEKSEDKDEMLEKALRVISFFVKDDWLVERNLQKIKSN